MKEYKEYKVYLFDFDFTLANSGDGIAMCFQKLFKNHGYNDIDDWEIKKTIGIPLKECFTILVGVKDPQVLEEWRKEFTVYGDEMMIPNTPLFPNTVPMLKRLKKDGKKVGIISTKFRRRVMQTLERFGAESYVDFLVGIDEVDIPKPDPTGLLRGMEKLGGTRERTLYIGDSTIDANTAKNAGVDFVAVTTGTTPAGAFKDLPHTRIISDIGQLY